MSGIGYGIHVFVCENQRVDGHPRGCCAARGGAQVRVWLKEAMNRHGLMAGNRANGAGCLDYCEQGPCLVVYPEGVWYSAQTREDVEEIVTEHLRDGRIVERLRLEALDADV